MEILTVVSIIAILFGVLIPALSMVRNFAKETRQKAQFASIELALLAFRSDYGDYPPSEWHPQRSPDYCGAQKLAEALVGWDLLGFHPKSAWRADGYDDTGGDGTYDPDKIRYNAGDGVYETFNEREKGRYLELETANAFRLGTFTDPVTSIAYPGLYNDPAPLEAATFVLCDTFNIKTMTMPGPAGEAVTRKAGTPILYYRANTQYKAHGTVPPLNQQIYDATDNMDLVDLGRIKDGEDHEIKDDDGSWDFSDFYDYITDPKVTTIPWPYNPDSYILISAGLDGFYGTEDDITNF